MTYTTLAPNQRIQNRENYSTVDAKRKNKQTNKQNTQQILFECMKNHDYYI